MNMERQASGCLRIDKYLMLYSCEVSHLNLLNIKVFSCRQVSLEQKLLFTLALEFSFNEQKHTTGL